MVLEQVKQDISVRLTLIESKFAGSGGGHRFWLFIFNIFATWFAVSAFFTKIGGVAGVIVVAMLFVVFAVKFDVNKAWAYVSGGR